MADPIPYEERIGWFGFDNAVDDPAVKRGASFFAFNTTVDIYGFGSAEACRRSVGEAIGLCRTWERLFSRTLPHSDVARLNSAQGAWIAIAPQTAQLLRTALEYCRLSGGVFDITIGAASRLWDFREGHIPDPHALERALEAVDWHRVQLDNRADGTVRARLDDPRAMIDLGGIAKGWMADRLIEHLAAAGLAGAVVNLGGNVAVHGAKPNGQPWIVGIRHPFDSRTLIGSIAMRAGAVVTSGIGERSFKAGGALLHHILGPRTGWPVQTDAASISVVAPTATAAEGFSTTLVALGMEEGRAFAAAQSQITQAYLVDENARIVPAKEPDGMLVRRGPHACARQAKRSIAPSKKGHVSRQNIIHYKSHYRKCAACRTMTPSSSAGHRRPRCPYPISTQRGTPWKC